MPHGVVSTDDQLRAGSPVPQPRPRRLSAHAATVAPGLALACGIAGAATVIGSFVPLVGGPVSGIVIGVVFAGLVKPGSRLRPGIRFASSRILQLSVVVLGAQLSLGQVLRVGATSLPVMVVTLAVCLLAAYFVGRWLGVVGDVRTLVGVGTGICGASAIAAVTPLIGAASIDVAFAVSTIFLFNIAAVLTFPLLGHVLGLSQHAFGTFAGTAVNDMSSVVAASSTYGAAAENHAVVVKLTRMLLIIPICIGLAALAARRSSAAAQQSRVRVHRLVPWFLVGFLVLAAANSAGIVPASIHHEVSNASTFLIAVALSALGLTTDLAGFRRTGPRPLVLGAALWVLVSLTSLGMQVVTGSL